MPNFTEIKSLKQLNTKLKKAGDQLVVIDCMADWCGPCKMLLPKLHDMADRYSSVVFIQVNIDTSPDVAEEYDVMSLPTVFFFKNQGKIGEVIGASDKKIQHFIEKNQ